MNNTERDELLVRMDERVLVIHDRLADGDIRMKGHGKRIASLERWRSAIAAGIAVALFVIGLAVRALF